MDAIRTYANGDFAFTNVGGIRANLVAGEVTSGMVKQVLPFNNQVVSIHLSGKELLDMVEDRVTGTHRGLQISGAKLVIDRTKQDYERITQFDIKGEPIHPDTMYSVVTSDYIAQGNIGFDMFPKLPEDRFYYHGITMFQVVVDYIRANTPIEPYTDGRWVEIKE
jgi:2',3'-cyclic-nucleotide 2'-phosphodiesterase (5'-nucleotidase family)